MDVEHMLAAARDPSEALAETLDALAVELKWPKAPSFPCVPFGTWGEVVVLYCRGGHRALEGALGDPILRDFALSLLVEIGDEQSLEIVLRLAEQLELSNSDDLNVAHGVASAINFLGRGGAGASAQSQWRASEFLNRLLPVSREPGKVGVVPCALRFFGNDRSLPLIAALPELPPAWRSVRKAAMRAIKKRVGPPA